MEKGESKKKGENRIAAIGLLPGIARGVANKILRPVSKSQYRVMGKGQRGRGPGSEKTAVKGKGEGKGSNWWAQGGLNKGGKDRKEEQGKCKIPRSQKGGVSGDYSGGKAESMATR